VVSVAVTVILLRLPVSGKNTLNDGHPVFAYIFGVLPLVSLVWIRFICIFKK
jgi:hypothetical protein